MSQVVALPAQQPTGALSPQNMQDAVKLAEIMSTGKLLPAHLQGKPGDCLMVIEQAIRWGMSPFAVAQATSVIQGQLMFEGKLVAAAIHASGVLSGRLSFDFAGQGDSRKVIVKGTLRGEAAPREVEVILKDARTNNQLWQKQPDQQLVYHGTRVWARRHAPEVMLGVYSPDEMDEPAHVGPDKAKDVTPSQPAPEPEPPKPANGEVAAKRWVEQERPVLAIMATAVARAPTRTEVRRREPVRLREASMASTPRVLRMRRWVARLRITTTPGMSRAVPRMRRSVAR